MKISLNLFRLGIKSLSKEKMETYKPIYYIVFSMILIKVK